MAITAHQAGTVNTATSGSSVNATALASAPPAGDLLTLAVAFFNRTVSSVTATSTFTKALAEQNGSDNDAEIWYAANCTGGGSGAGSDKEPTVNASGTLTDGVAVWYNDWAGAATSSALDGTGTFASGALSPGTYTPSQNGDLLISVCSSSTTSTTSPGSPWTDLGAENASSYLKSDAIYLIQTAATPENPTFGGFAAGAATILIGFKTGILAGGGTGSFSFLGQAPAPSLAEGGTGSFSFLGQAPAPSLAGGGTGSFSFLGQNPTEPTAGSLGSGSGVFSFLGHGAPLLTVYATGTGAFHFAGSGTGVVVVPSTGGAFFAFVAGATPTLVATGAAVFVFVGGGVVPLPPLPTPPAPLTWADAYVQGDQLSFSKLSVYSPEGEWILDLPFTAASAVEDETQQVRWTLTATIPSEGLAVAQNPNLGDELVPVNPGDLLHPVTCNEVRAFRGWVFPNGSELLLPWGVYRMSKPADADTGSSVLITLTGLDRSSVISRQTWTEPYAIVAGTNLGTAIMDGLNDRWPDALPPLEFDFAETTLTVPATVFGADISSGTNDPFADFMGLATAAGCELFFDETGVVVFRPVPVPTAAPVVWTFTEDQDCTLVATIGRTLDETQTYNGVLAIGNGVSGAPVSVTVWDSDPESPTYYMGKWGRTPYPLITSLIPAPGQSTAEAQAQLLVMAVAQFQLVMGAFDDTSFQAVPLPALYVGNGLGLIKARLGIDAEYIASRVEMPFDYSTPMTVTNRPRRQAGAEQ